jgi:hypothetical protein
VRTGARVTEIPKQKDKVIREWWEKKDQGHTEFLRVKDGDETVEEKIKVVAELTHIWPTE